MSRNYKRLAALALIVGLGAVAAISAGAAASGYVAATQPAVEQKIEHTKESRCCDAK